MATVDGDVIKLCFEIEFSDKGIFLTYAECIWMQTKPDYLIRKPEVTVKLKGLSVKCMN